jgi:uncharacterized SAM-binding protein YcdF (DUF218 family)
MNDVVLRKLLELAEPLALAWLLLTLWFLGTVFRRRTLALFPTLAWLILSAVTCTPLPSWLLDDLEGQTAAVDITNLAAGDVILCLGGGAEPSFVESTGVYLKKSANRISAATTLAAQGKAATLVIGGGGYSQDGEKHSEADAVARYLQNQGSLSVSIQSLGVCADTRDEVNKFVEMARQRGWQRVLLVTSASHMPRAVATFAKAGMQVTAVPCDYQSSFSRIGEVYWVHLPHANNLSMFATWFHEMVGSWMYRIRGWI